MGRGGEGGVFFFKETATTEIYTLSRHDALPIFNDQLKPHGLQLPLDLSTSNRATIGGMLANNSAGTRSIIYGKTIDFVEELTVVMADGRVVDMLPLAEAGVEARCAQKDLEGACYRIVRQLAAEHGDEIRRRYPRILRRVGGYNLDDFVSPEPFELARLLVGSEGTLALTVDATLRLEPLPVAKALCTVQFEDVLEALQYANVGQGILAGFAILFCAMILDRIVQGKRR